jgi:outer membrane lipoprotein-sorting protein
MKGFLNWNVMVIMLFCFILTLPVQASAGMSAYDIVKKSEDLLDQAKDSKVEMTMTLVNKKGDKRERSLIAFAKKEGEKKSKSILFFKSPADVKGTSFLVWTDENKEDKQWLYLPALQRVRQVSTSGKGESFMGTELTFFDMGSQDINAYNFTLLKDESVNNELCYMIKAVPKKVEFYNEITIWIRKNNFIPIKAVFYDTKGQYLKQGLFMNVKSIQGINTPTHIEIYNEQNGRKTIIDLNNIVYNSGLKNDMFTERFMTRGM